MELDWAIKAFLGEEQECRNEVEEKLANLQGFAEGLTLKPGLHAQTTNWQLELEMAYVKVSLSDERVVQRELEDKIALLMNELEEFKALVSRSMDTIGAQELDVRETKYYDALADQLQSSCPPDREECVLMILVVNLSRRMCSIWKLWYTSSFLQSKSSKICRQLLRKNWRQQLLARRSMSATSPQLLNVSNDCEAELVKFCKDVGESSREQLLKCQN